MSFEEKQKALLRAEIFAGLLFEEQFIEMVFREAENMLDLEQSAGYRRIFNKGMEKGMADYWITWLWLKTPGNGMV